MYLVQDLIFFFFLYWIPKELTSVTNPGGSDGKASVCSVETWVRSLDGEDPLEEGMATHSSILAWRIPWTEEPGGLRSLGSQRVGHDWVG